MNLQIQKYRNDINVMHDTAKQITKDFGLEEGSILISGDPQNAYSELELQLIPVISDLYSGRSADLMNLLYRIDVNESQIKKALAVSDPKGVVIMLTGLILEREFIKCVTRKVYS